MNLTPWKREDRTGAVSFQQWVDWMVTYGGHTYGLGNGTLQPSAVEAVDGDFAGLARAYKGNPVVAACVDVRAALFAEARFKFRQLRSGRPGDLFGNPDLALLENPWPQGTTGDLLTRMEQDSTFEGSFYARITRTGLQRMRPDWVNILLGSKKNPDEANLQLDAEIIGYAYYPGGPRKEGVEPILLNVNEVVHYMQKPDPLARFRGLSWLGALTREIMADTGYTDHKLKFLENGATPNLIMVLDKDVLEANARIFKEMFEEQNEGLRNRYKTMFVGGGATPMPVGNSFKEMDFKVTQGAGETRIAAAAGVPPVIVGLSEGLQGSSLNEGNYMMARRRFADITMRPLWRKAAAALAVAVKVPVNAELWYDDRDIAALQEDQKDAAEISQMTAGTMKTLLDAGFEADSVVKAVAAEDFTLLVHSGLFSVQLQPPGTVTPPTNGAVSPADAQAALAAAN